MNTSTLRNATAADPTLDVRAYAAEAERGWDFEVPIGDRRFPILPPSAVREVCSGSSFIHRPLPVRCWLRLRRWLLGSDPILAERLSAAAHVPPALRHHVERWDANDVLLFVTAGMAAQQAWQERVFRLALERASERLGVGDAVTAVAPTAAAKPSGGNKGVQMRLRPGGPLPPFLGGGTWGPRKTGGGA